jgi:hypothetical protein
MTEAEVTDALTVLDGMERDLLERSVLSERIRPAYVDLRSHIALVRERLARRQAQLNDRVADRNRPPTMG